MAARRSGITALTLVLAAILPAGAGPAATPAPADSTAAATYYVSPAGNDSNPGTSAAPWATPGYGSRQLKPGDTLMILDGRYILKEYDAHIVTPPAGTADAWITIKGEAGKRPVLAARENLLTAIELSNARYVRIENLEVTSDGGALFRDGIEALGGPAEHVVLESLYIHHLDEFCVNIGDALDLRILNSTIEYCGFGAVGGPAGTVGGWRDILIRNSSLSYSGHYYQGGPGPSPYDRPDGFGIEGSNGPIDLDHVSVEHNRGDGLDSKANQTHIHESIVANNNCDGVKLWGGGSRVENTLIYGRGDGNSTGTPWSAVVIDAQAAGSRFELVNVAMDDQLGGNYLVHVQYDRPTIPVSLVMRNVIFSSRGADAPIYLAAAVNYTIDHDIFHFPNSSLVLDHGGTTYDLSQLSALGIGNLGGDPGFIRPAWGREGDYHLQASSRAIDNGSANGAPGSDLDGRARPSGTAVDIGPYEGVGGPVLDPPHVISTQPLDGTQGVDTAASVTVLFDLPMEPASTAAAFQLSPVVAGVSVQVTGNNLTLSHIAALAANTSYLATLATSAKSSTGVALQSPYSFTFTTAPRPPPIPAPKVVSVAPSDAATGVAVDATVVVTFDLEMDATTTVAAFSISPTVAGGVAQVSGKRLTWTHPGSLAASTKYSVQISIAASSAHGVHLASTFSTSFTTASASPAPQPGPDPTNQFPPLMLAALLIVGAVAAAAVVLLVAMRRMRKSAKDRPAAEEVAP